MKLGELVTRTPETFADYDPKTRKSTVRPMRGKIVDIHPEGRFHTVAFDLPGGVVRESFVEESV